MVEKEPFTSWEVTKGLQRKRGFGATRAAVGELGMAEETGLETPPEGVRPEGEALPAED